jgi:hypothetical protein
MPLPRAGSADEVACVLCCPVQHPEIQRAHLNAG